MVRLFNFAVKASKLLVHEAEQLFLLRGFEEDEKK